MPLHSRLQWQSVRDRNRLLRRRCAVRKRIDVRAARRRLPMRVHRWSHGKKLHRDSRCMPVVSLSERRYLRVASRLVRVLVRHGFHRALLREFHFALR